MGRTLAMSVHLGDGRSFAAGTEVDDDVADLITNPMAWGEDAGAEPGARDVPDGAQEAPAPPSVQRPKDNASKDEWVAYAGAQGFDKAEAEKLSRNELRDLFPEA